MQQCEFLGEALRIRASVTPGTKGTGKRSGASSSSVTVNRSPGVAPLIRNGWAPYGLGRDGLGRYGSAR